MTIHSRALRTSIAVLISCALAGTTVAQIQTHKLIPDDGAAEDDFGWSVAVSGNTAIVGSPRDDNGSAVGAAYLFNAATGAQIAKLRPDYSAPLDSSVAVFGYSVAISGNTAIIGNPRFNISYQGEEPGGPGSAYLFNATTGEQIAEIMPDDGAPDDLFGYSVAISGNTAIVGRFKDDDNGVNSGAAYLFNATTGAQIAKIKPDDGAAFDHFGGSVAISGNTAIVGSHGDDDNGIGSGSAYLFNATTGVQIAKIKPDDGAAEDWFGSSVAISGNTVIVGKPGDDDNVVDSGAAYLFNATTGTQIAKIKPASADSTTYDSFGGSVAISGNTAIVGKSGDGDNGIASGSAYLFNTTTGTQIAKITPADGAAYDTFGASVSISGNIAIVGSPRDDDNGRESGSAYLFSVPNAGVPDVLSGYELIGALSLLGLAAYRRRKGKR